MTDFWEMGMTFVVVLTVMAAGLLAAIAVGGTVGWLLRQLG